MRKIRLLFWVAGTAFLLHLVWEYAQCGTFFDMENSLEHQVLMITATLGDMNIALALFLLLGWIHRDFFWIRHGMNRSDWGITLFYSIALTFYFETRALTEGRWAYSEYMPLVPGTSIGLLPIIQLFLLIPLGFFLAQWLDDKTQQRSLQRNPDIKDTGKE